MGGGGGVWASIRGPIFRWSHYREKGAIYRNHKGTIICGDYARARFKDISQMENMTYAF